jgi:hypothetical protein
LIVLVVLLQPVVLGFDSSTATATNGINIQQSLAAAYYGPPLVLIDAVENPAAVFQVNLPNSDPAPIVEIAFCQPDIVIDFMDGMARCVEITIHHGSPLRGISSAQRSSRKRSLSQ